jgi:tRNA C32,U32 (ribose-2'-O)-methylase TrmJ
VTTARLRQRKKKRAERADLQIMEGAVAELTRLMERVGYTRAVAADKVALTTRRALQSAAPRVRDVDALRGMIARVDWALSNPELDWRASRKSNEDASPETEEP